MHLDEATIVHPFFKKKNLGSCSGRGVSLRLESGKSSTRPFDREDGVWPLT